MNNTKNEKKAFNFDTANLADQISVIGCLEHIYEHALKAAASSKENEAIFYMTLADIVKEFRRDFMREHFPDVGERDWCLLKAVDTMRQRIYESAHTSYPDLKSANDIWATVTEHIFGVDMSGCVACRQDAGKDPE